MKWVGMNRVDKHKKKVYKVVLSMKSTVRACMAWMCLAWVCRKHDISETVTKK
jgi:hypothetical protein